MIDEQLAALASETRRQVLLLIVDRARSVQEVADRLPVSRPAVSQHLKVLVEAGLASARQEGARRLYAADAAGIEALRRWTEQLWSSALDGIAALAAPEQLKEGTMAKIVQPVVKTLRTPWSSADAFDVFTERIAEWWPLDTHSVGDEHAVSVAIEPGVGGRIVETVDDGTTHVWGTVIEWEEGRHLAFSWHPGHEEALATTVDVRFRDVDGGCEVLLVHVGWEVRGDRAEEVRARYQTGWDPVLARYQAA
ncbi:MAG: metalloregulator ArsR/SmtB family transcription factor [Nitriliruptorales bacterium]|nr:metalloregulator ArsR/SmtB family transcription factor [Nitriliruptorales bacterium]